MSERPGSDNGSESERQDSRTTGNVPALIGITMPYERATLASIMPARIARIIPREGGFVKQGELVVQLDDAMQQSRVEITRAAAETTLAVDLARQEWDQARRDFERLEQLHSGASASSKELSDALALAETRRLEYELARFNHEQAVRAFAREQILLEEHRIRAPFSGHVIERLKHQGETVDQLEGIVTLYQLNPLKVFVDCPIGMAGRVQLTDDASITPVGANYASRTGRVLLVSPVTDPGSQTFRVKILVDNQDGDWMAGMKVNVHFVPRSESRARLIGDVPTSAPGVTPVNPIPGKKSPTEPAP